jgi:hypothetical protein
LCCFCPPSECPTFVSGGRIVQAATALSASILLDGSADFFARLPANPQDLTQSYYYLGSQQKQVIVDRNLYLLIPYVELLPGWVPWRKVSTALGFSIDAIEKAEQILGKPFVWGSEFENVHEDWHFNEPGFYFAGQRFAGPEQCYQLQKTGPPGSLEYENEVQ